MFSFGDNFTIQTQAGQNCFQVRSKLIAFGDQLSLRDMRGNKVAYISQTFGFQPRYTILDGSKQRQLAQMVKEWTFFSKKFALTSGGHVVNIDGNFFAHDFTFVSGGRCLARVSKRVFSWSDSYSVEILSDMVDAKVILCACIIVDQVLHDD